MIDSETRACIAAIALAHAGSKTVTSLYDYDRDRHLDISVRFDGDALIGQHAERKAKFSGKLPDIFDHSRNSYIHIKGEQGQYIGFDHHTATHFTLEIRENTTALYDYGAEAWSQYSL